MKTPLTSLRALPVVEVAVVVALAAPLPAAAQAPGPGDIVDAFHAALAAGDSVAALGFLSSDVVIFESGGAEMSREEYRRHHLGADMEFSGSTTREITERRVEAGEDVAVVLTRSATAGTFRDHDINSVGVETMIVVRTDNGWEISHIHWSSRRSPDAEP